MAQRINHILCTLSLIAVFILFALISRNNIKQNLPTAPPKVSYPRAIGKKFDADGNVLPYRGNTIIAHLPASCELRTALMRVYPTLEASALNKHLYTLLPPSSWHMTIFEGATNQTRKANYWPADLALNAPMSECDALFARKLSAFDLRARVPFHLSFDTWQPFRGGITLDLLPVDERENTVLRTLRDRLADTLQFRKPDHDTYGFHITLAYLLRFPTEEQKAALKGLLDPHTHEIPKEFELGAPEFCTFENMHAFTRQFYLPTDRD